MSLTNSTFDADIDHLDDAASIDNEPTGHLAIVHSRFLHNTGGQGTEVISNTGNATITDSAFDDNTILPLYNDGRVSVRGTRFSTNHTQYYVPGAIENYAGGLLNLGTSTIDHNIGAIGGGITNVSAARATLADDTITDNIALDGIWSGRTNPCRAVASRTTR